MRVAVRLDGVCVGGPDRHGLSKEIRRLFKLLRGEVGQDFLREARVVCDYRVEQFFFLRSYAQNFVELHVPPAVG